MFSNSISVNEWKNVTNKKVKFKKQNIIAVLVIAVAFFIERLICYRFNIIINAYKTLPMPCIKWTLSFGIVMRCIYVILLPVYDAKEKKVLSNIKLIVFTLGGNWIIFNSFIGLTHKDIMFDAILRTSIDILVMFSTIYIIDKFLDSTIRNKV